MLKYQKILFDRSTCISIIDSWKGLTMHSLKVWTTLLQIKMFPMEVFKVFCM